MEAQWKDSAEWTFLACAAADLTEKPHYSLLHTKSPPILQPNNTNTCTHSTTSHPSQHSHFCQVPSSQLHRLLIGEGEGGLHMAEPLAVDLSSTPYL